MASDDDDLVAGGSWENAAIANKGNSRKQEVGIRVISGLSRKSL